MARKRLFTEEEKEKIVNMNNHNYSYRKICKELNCDYKTLANFMKENSIEKTKHSLKNHNIKRDYFETIDTEEKAYFLGLMITDGYVKEKKGSNLFGISLKSEDKYMIENFKKELNSDVKIYHDKRDNKECYSIEITNQKMCDDLKNFNIVPNKTYLLNDINIELIPENFRKDYLRGIIDGDGSIGIDNGQIWISLTGYSEDFVKSFEYEIDRIISKEKHNKIHKANAYFCRWKGNKISKKILDYLYKDATIYLERKKRFYDLINSK